MPDKVNLLVELAKNVDSYKMPKGTRVKAGKDNTGVEMHYETEREIVLNKALVKSLKTLYADKSLDYKTLYLVMRSASVAGFDKYRLAIMKK